MARELEEDEIEDLLSSNSEGSYYWMEENPDITHEVIFRSPINITEAYDGNGTPDLDLAGNEWKNEWPLIQALAEVDGEKKILGLQWSLLNKIRYLSRKNGILNSELPGTIWSITREDKNKFIVTFEGHEKEKMKSTKSTEKAIKRKKLVDNYKLVADALDNIKEEFWDDVDSVSKDSLIIGLCTATKLKHSEIEKYLPRLVKDGKIEIDEDTVTFLE